MTDNLSVDLSDSESQHIISNASQLGLTTSNSTYKITVSGATSSDIVELSDTSAVEIAPSGSGDILSYTLQLGSSGDMYQPSSTYSSSASESARGASVQNAFVAGGEGFDYILFGRTMFAGAVSQKVDGVYTESEDSTQSSITNEKVSGDGLITSTDDSNKTYIENDSVKSALLHANVLVAGENFYTNSTVTHTQSIEQDVVFSKTNDTVLMFVGEENMTGDHKHAIAPTTLNIHHFGSGDSILALNVADDIGGSNGKTPFMLIQSGTPVTGENVAGSVSKGVTYNNGTLTIVWNNIEVLSSESGSTSAKNDAWEFDGVDTSGTPQDLGSTTINFLGGNPDSLVVTLLGENSDGNGAVLYSSVIPTSA